MSGDECAHAFAIPDNFGFRVTFFDELGEGVEIVIPLGGVSDVAAPRVDGVAALAAEFVGVNGGVGLAFDEIVSEVRVVDGVSTKTMNPDDDHILLEVVAFPGSVSECFAIWVDGHGIIPRRAAAKGGEQER